ncbi:MAG: hypothetical protein HON90_04115 [Halobacteriovoraceae bacterium]|jgi:hypothetical protein|nr:hypothetical protein [Halobacteriovoraceae bacterium]
MKHLIFKVTAIVFTVLSLTSVQADSEQRTIAIKNILISSESLNKAIFLVQTSDMKFNLEECELKNTATSNCKLLADKWLSTDEFAVERFQDNLRFLFEGNQKRFFDEYTQRGQAINIVGINLLIFGSLISRPAWGLTWVALNVIIDSNRDTLARIFRTKKNLSIPYDMAHTRLWLVGTLCVYGCPVAIYSFYHRNTQSDYEIDQAKLDEASIELQIINSDLEAFENSEILGDLSSITYQAFRKSAISAIDSVIVEIPNELGEEIEIY